MMVFITWCVPDREILAQRFLWFVAHQTIGFAKGRPDPHDPQNGPGIKADQALTSEENINFRNLNGSVLGSVGYIFWGRNLYSPLR
jgi:hypothetical protein